MLTYSNNGTNVSISSAQVNAQIQNLNIKVNGNKTINVTDNYVIYNPTNTNPIYQSVQFEFTVQDITKGNYYMLWFYFWPTRSSFNPAPSDICYVNGYVTAPGTYITPAWELPAGGTYNYDIIAVECTDYTNPIGTAIDSQWLKSVEAGFSNDELVATDMSSYFYTMNYTTVGDPSKPNKLMNANFLVFTNDTAPSAITQTLSADQLTYGDHAVSYTDPSPNAETRALLESSVYCDSETRDHQNRAAYSINSKEGTFYMFYMEGHVSVYGPAISTLTVQGAIAPTGQGNAKVLLGTANPQRQISVAVNNGDDAPTVAGKIRTALAADGILTAYKVSVSGTGNSVILTSPYNCMPLDCMTFILDNDTCNGLMRSNSVADLIYPADHITCLDRDALTTVTQNANYQFINPVTQNTQLYKVVRQDVDNQSTIEIEGRTPNGSADISADNKWNKLTTLRDPSDANIPLNRNVFVQAHGHYSENIGPGYSDIEMTSWHSPSHHAYFTNHTTLGASETATTDTHARVILTFTGPAGTDIPVHTLVEDTATPPHVVYTMSDAQIPTTAPFQINILARARQTESFHDVYGNTLTKLIHAIAGVTVTNNYLPAGNDYISFADLNPLTTQINANNATQYPHVNLAIFDVCNSEFLGDSYHQKKARAVLCVDKDYTITQYMMPIFYSEYLLPMCVNARATALGSPTDANSPLGMAIHNWVLDVKAGAKFTPQDNTTTGASSYYGIDKLLLLGDQSVTLLPYTLP